MIDTPSRAVRFDRYGEADVLYVTDVPRPVPAAGEALVEIRAAGINPGETAIRQGVLHGMFPATFPSGEGSDLAGVVVALGAEVDELEVGDEVLGYSWSRSSHATHAAVPASQLVRKPAGLAWEIAGALFVAGTTAWAAVEAVDPRAGETVAVSAASGGVGAIAVQLLATRGVKTLGIASESNSDWLAAHGAIPVPYGAGLLERVRAAAPSGVDAFIDLFGPDYVHLAVELGVPTSRIETIISFEAAAEVGAKTAGSADAANQTVMAELARMAAEGTLEVPIAAAYPLGRVADAYRQLEARHTRGKIVLIP